MAVIVQGVAVLVQGVPILKQLLEYGNKLVKTRIMNSPMVHIVYPLDSLSFTLSHAKSFISISPMVFEI